MALTIDKLLFSNLLKHNVCGEEGINHGPIVSPWMHPPAHRILGCVSRPSTLRLERHVWRLDQIKGITQLEVYAKGNFSISNDKTLDRFPTLMNANIFNRNGQKLGLIADFFFDLKTGKIEVSIEYLEVLSVADELPMPVFGDQDYPEEIRLKYRFLDIRRDDLHKNLILRSLVISFIREQMTESGFIESASSIITTL